MKQILKLAIGLAVATLANPVQAEPDYTALSQEIITAHITPRYNAFAARADNLQAVIGNWCDGDPASRASVLVAFNDAVTAWQSVEHVRFGVASELSAHSRVNYWPDRGDRVNKHLRRLMANPDLAEITGASFFDRSIAVQGFPALERLIHDTPYRDQIDAGTDQPGPGANACSVAKAIAHNIAAVADILASSWQGAPASHDLAAAAFNDLATGLIAVAEVKLGGPSGAESDRVRAKRAENWRSGRALENVSLNLSALRDLYQHLADAAPQSSANAERDNLIRSQFTATITTVDKLGPDIAGPLSSEDGREQVLDLAHQILALRDEVVGYISESLSIPLGFNSLDGD